MQRHTALVVDDQPASYEAIRAALEQAGFEIAGAAASLTHGMQLLRRHQPDIAVLDLALAGLTGMAAVHAFHDAAPACALVVLSPFADLSDAASQAGALVLVDPRDLRQLEAAVRNVRVRLEQDDDHRSRLGDGPPIPRQSQDEPTVVVDVTAHRPRV
jgi:two-component system, LytTR family, response regulator AlgR